VRTVRGHDRLDGARPADERQEDEPRSALEPAYIEYLAAKLQPFVKDREARLASSPAAEPVSAFITRRRRSESRDS